MNLVILVIDTLGRNYLGTYGCDWIETPSFDRLADASMVYDYSFTHSYPTVPHRTDMLCGEYGAPFHAWMPLRHDRRTFIEELGRHGYCTQLLHDSPHLVNGGHNFDWPFHAWEQIRGAEVDRPWIDNLPDQWPANWATDSRFDFVEESRHSRRLVTTYARANRHRSQPTEWNCAKLFLRASEFVRENRTRQNFVLWVDCFDPHEPWDSPPDFVRRYDRTPGYDGRLDPRSFAFDRQGAMPEAAAAHLRAQFAAKVAWVDHWLGQFLGTLEAEGMLDTTAILLTADHGTNVGERGRFGKSMPVREHEARTPLFIRAPGLAPGRSDIIVQPQDIYATVMALLGQPAPTHLDSHDVIAAAQRGDGGARQLALAGGRADHWRGKRETTLFSAFTRDWCLELAANPAHTRLTRLGTTADVAAAKPVLVAELQAAAIAELANHGAPPALVEWLRHEGTTPWPEDILFWDGYPGPAGYYTYFDRIHVDG